MTLQLNTTDVTRTYTNEEFEVLPEFDGRFELLDGRVVAKAMPSDIHGWICDTILGEIYAFDRKRKLGAAWTNATFVIRLGWEPIPDLGYIIASRVPKIRSEKSIKVVPDLVVEVHSPGDLDSKVGYNAALNKVGKYLEAGVRIVWAINCRAQTVEVYHHGQSEPWQTLGVKDRLDGEDVIPGFELKVARLFE